MVSSFRYFSHSLILPPQKLAQGSIYSYATQALPRICLNLYFSNTTTEEWVENTFSFLDSIARPNNLTSATMAVVVPNDNANSKNETNTTMMNATISADPNLPLQH
jgi:hypothetical protein